jgi:hypothetical protein
MNRLSLEAFKAKVGNSKLINQRTIMGGNSGSCSGESKKSRGISMDSGDMAN